MWMLLLLACRDRPAAPAPRPDPAPSEAARVPAEVWTDHALRPSDAPAGQPVCTVIALHGRGDTPERFARLFDGLHPRVQVLVPRAPDAFNRGWSWIPPGSPGAARATGPITSGADRLVDALASAPLPHPIDGLPVFTGFSQGGILSYAVAARRPDAVRAVFPVGGMLPDALFPTEGPGVVVRGLHGELDDVIPLAPTRALVDAMQRAGWDAELSVYPDTAHTIPPAMRAELHAGLTAACGLAP